MPEQGFAELLNQLLAWTMHVTLEAGAVNVDVAIVVSLNF
jgi:hypothetical protein